MQDLSISYSVIMIPFFHCFHSNINKIFVFSLFFSLSPTHSSSVMFYAVWGFRQEYRVSFCKRILFPCESEMRMRNCVEKRGNVSFLCFCWNHDPCLSQKKGIEARKVFKSGFFHSTIHPLFSSISNLMALRTRKKGTRHFNLISNFHHAHSLRFYSF